MEAEISYLYLKFLWVMVFITAIKSKVEQGFSTLLHYWCQHHQNNKPNLQSQDDRSLSPPSWCRCNVSSIVPTWKLLFFLSFSLSFGFLLICIFIYTVVMNLAWVIVSCILFGNKNDAVQVDFCGGAEWRSEHSGCCPVRTRITKYHL